MTPTEIEGKRNATIVGQKQISARLTNDVQLLNEIKNELKLSRLQVYTEHINKGGYKIKTPSPMQWFCEWGSDGGEKRRIEICQSEAKTKRYGQLYEPAFLF